MKNLFNVFLFLILILFFATNSYAAKGMAQRIEEKIGLDEDATLQERVDAIGQRVASACDRKDMVYTFKVLKDEEFNAFALPDGYVYIYRGLVDRIKTDDEIAAVLAHELGHMAARHHEKRYRRMLLANIFRFVAVTGADTRQDKVNINNAVIELALSYSKEEEIEADKLSAIYLKRAGYNPEAVISMLQTLIKTEMQGPIRPKMNWRSHPYLSDRIRAAREEISGQINFVDYMNTPTHGVER